MADTSEGEDGAQGPAMGRGYRMLCMGLLVALGFSLGASEFVVIGIQPELARDFGIPLSQAGLFMSAFSITYAAMTPVLALVGGRFARFPLLIAYSALFILGNLVAMLASTFEVLLAARVLVGLVSGALLAVGVTFIPELIGQERTSAAISWVYAAFSVAMVVSTSVGKVLAASVGWHYALVGSFWLSVATCAALIALLPRRGATDAPAGIREQLPFLADPRSLCGAAVFVFGVGAVYVFYGYVTPYLEDILGLTTVQASAALMASGVAAFFSNLISGWIDTRFGVGALRFTFTGQALLLLALFLLGPAMPAALAIILAIGLSMYLVSVPCVNMFVTTAANEYPQALTLASSLEPAAFNIGIAFGTAVGGAVIAGPGMGWVGAVGALFALIACGIVCVTLRVTRRLRAQRP